jgi:hypothetical protein
MSLHAADSTFDEVLNFPLSIIKYPFSMGEKLAIDSARNLFTTEATLRRVTKHVKE